MTGPTFTDRDQGRAAIQPALPLRESASFITAVAGLLLALAGLAVDEPVTIFAGITMGVAGSFVVYALSRFLSRSGTRSRRRHPRRFPTDTAAPGEPW